MPLTKEDKRRLLASNGYDPSKFRLDETTGDVYEGQEPEAPVEPTFNASSVVPASTSKSTTFGTLARGATQAAFPSLGAIAGGALAAAPFTGGTSLAVPLIAGLGGALATGYGASKLQEAIVPKEIQEQIFLRPQDIQEHPIAATIGELAPNAIAFNPVKSVAALGRGVKGIGQMLASPRGAATLLPEELAGLRNLGINTGVNVGTQAGLNIAQQAMSDQPFSVGELAKSAATGLLFNEPTKLAQRRLGFRPSFEGVPTQAEVIARNREILGRRGAVEDVVEPSYTQSIDPATLALEQRRQGIESTPAVLTERGTRKLEEKTYGLPGLKHRDEPVLETRALETLEGEGGPSPREVEIESQRELDFYKARLEKEKQDAIILAKTETENLAIENSNRQRQLGIALGTKATPEAIIGRGITSRPEVRPSISPGATQPDYQAQQRQAALKNKIKPKTEAERIQEEYDLGKRQEESAAAASFTSLEPEIDTLLAKRGIRKGQYRVTITDAQGNPILGSKGKPIAGQAKYSKREVSFGKEAGADTAYHEAGHVYLEDMARSSNPKDRALVSHAFAEAGYPELSAEEFVRLNDAERAGDTTARDKYIAAEESLMDYIGFEGAKRKLGGSKGKQYFKDYLSRFGLGEKPGRQQLAAGLEYDAPRRLTGDEFEAKPNVSKFQEESKPEVVRLASSETKNTLGDPMGTTYRATPEDWTSWQRVQEGMKRIITEGGDFDGPEMMALRKENETIKNKYGGMPPQEPKVSQNATKKEQIKEGLPPERGEGSSIRKETETGPSDSIQREGEGEVGKSQEESKSDAYEIDRLRRRIEQQKEIIRNSPEDKIAKRSLNRMLRELEERTGAKNMEESRAEEITKGMQRQLETSAIRKAKEAEGASIKAKEIREAGLPTATSVKAAQEAFKQGLKKSEELEAFTRPDKEKNQEESAIRSELQKKPILNVFTSVTDRIGAGERSKSHTLVSKSLRNYFDERDYNIGRYGQSWAETLSGYSPKENENVYRYRWEKDNGLMPSIRLSPNEQKLNDEIQSILQRPKEDAAKLGLKVKRGEVYTTGGIKPEGYLPNQLDPVVLAELESNPSSIESKKYRRQWAEWLKKKGAPNPEKLIKEWEAARREYGDTGGPEFAALRKPEGYGLPWELMDKNPARAAMRYGRRAASDLAWFKHIQSKEDVRAALGVKDQEGNLPKDVEGIDFIGSEKDVQSALKFVYGKTASEYPRLAAFSKTVGDMIMGPGTAIRNLASIPNNLAAYDVTIRQAFKGLSEIASSRQRAIESGAVKLNQSDFERLEDIDNPDKVVAFFNKASNLFRTVQGRNLSDKLEGELYYAIGEEWAKTKMLEAKTGDNRAKKLLERTGNLVEGKFEPTPENIQKVAKGFVNVVRGTYGPQGLPAWALHGNISPFVALSRYSIEKWNNVYKDIGIPMKEGNPLPFLKYTLASLGIGVGIEELNKIISGKRGTDLELNEALAVYARTEDPEVLASKAISLAQLASFAGIMGDLAKLGVRAAEGKSLTYSNPLSFPAYSFASETVAQNLADALGAMKEGEDPPSVLAELIKTVAIQSVQAARYASNRLDRERTERKEEYSDIRKFKEATGKQTPQEGGRANEFEGLSAKKFKRTTDIGEAIEELPGLIQRAFEKAGSDPYRLKYELRKLKSNSYQILPSPENQPIEFYEYMDYLRDTQGEEAAAARLAKFLQQRNVNKVKSRLVP